MAALALIGLAGTLALTTAQGSQEVPSLEGDYDPPGWWMAELRGAFERGEIPDPTQRAIPPIPPSSPGAAATGAPVVPCLTSDHVFAFEDTNQVLLTNFSNGEMLDLMTDAANALMATHGDRYDFIGYWTNFTPDHKVGAAFYMPIENDVMGLGDPSTVGTPIFNDRAAMGLGGDNVEGYVMMWNVNNSYWAPGTASDADFTRLALAQEFEHRFALFLPDLLDGRTLQGDNGSCGRIFHWNWRVDGQGSGMEISEWVGAIPAQLIGSFVTFNTDIPGGVFSYSDLYLMGYVSPAEMDAGNSELRYMDTSDCSGDYFGAISTFSSADIIASAGPRVPDSTSAQKVFRTGWIMIHLPGAPPTSPQLDKAVAILEQHMIDWEFSTLGLGTMDNHLFDDCNCNGVPDADDLLAGTSDDLNGNAVPDECEPVGGASCFGNGSGTPCPCGNDATGPVRGCRHSGGVGMTIRGFGTTSVSADDLAMIAENCPTGNSGIFYAGKTDLSPGNQLFDGLQCAGGDVRRFQGLFQTTGTVVDTGFVAQDPSGFYFVAGATVHFQYWSRDVAAGPSPCGTAANFSPLQTVTMTP